MEKGVGPEKVFKTSFYPFWWFIHKVISGRIFYSIAICLCLFWCCFAENVMFDQPLFYFIVLNIFNKKLLTKKILTEVSLPLLLLAFFLLTPTHRRVLLEPRWQPGLSHSSATLSLDQLLTSAQHPHLHSVFCSLPTERKKKSWGSDEKRKGKIDQGPGEQKKKKRKKDASKCFLCNNCFASNCFTFPLKATLLGTQKWVFLFGNNSRRASEATAKLLWSRCFFSLSRQSI